MLTQGLGRVAAGDLDARVEPGGSDEIGEAVTAFNHMADQLAACARASDPRHAPGKLAGAGAQDGARSEKFPDADPPDHGRDHQPRPQSGSRVLWSKPRRSSPTKCRRWKNESAPSPQFAAEPPVEPREIDVNALVEERVSFLKSAHPDVIYNMTLAPGSPPAVADPDLIKGVLTNLLENAAEAAQTRRSSAGAHRAVRLETEYRSPRFRPRPEHAGAYRAYSNRPFRSRKAAWAWACRSPGAARCYAAATCKPSTENWAAQRSA